MFGLGVLRTAEDPSMTEEEIAGIMQQLEAARELGFISREGRTGRIQTFEDSVLTFNTPLGDKEALVGGETVVQGTKGNTTETLEPEDLQPGVLVTGETILTESRHLSQTQQHQDHQGIYGVGRNRDPSRARIRDNPLQVAAPAWRRERGQVLRRGSVLNE